MTERKYHWNRQFLKILKAYFPDLYANKPKKLDDVDNFIRKYYLLKLTQLDRKLKRLISLEEKKELMKELGHKKVPIPNGFIEKFYQIFKEHSHNAINCPWFLWGNKIHREILSVFNPNLFVQYQLVFQLSITAVKITSLGPKTL